MTEAEQLSLVVERIYDAALSAALWPRALEAACAFVPGCTGNLFYQDSSNHAVTLFCSWGEDANYRQLYLEMYAQFNPLFPASSFFEVGVVHALTDVMPLQEFRETRMYREWVQPQGILDVLYSNLERTATGAAAIAIRRRECDGLFDEAAKSRFRLILPHVRRAVSIGRVIDFHKTSEVNFAKTLDGLAAAILLVSGDGHIVFANEQASALLERSDILRLRQGRLAAIEPGADHELQDAIAAASRGDATLGVKGIAISLATHEHASHVGHVLSLTSGQRNDQTNNQATVALFVRPVTSPLPSSLELLARSFRLTASEVRVLGAVTETGSVEDLADRLGITKATVKTHLNHLFAKTGTRRQSDLIRLAAAYASPFA